MSSFKFGQKEIMKILKSKDGQPAYLRSTYIKSHFPMECHSIMGETEGIL